MRDIEPTLTAEKWLSGLAEFDGPNRLVLLCIFSVLGIPASYLDVGSGTGVMVNTARLLGVDGWGLDILPRPQFPHLVQHDLVLPYHFGREFDLITCIETAEHVELEGADNLVDTIALHAKLGAGRIVFTAAPPGQLGAHHVNCQGAEYWRAKFYERGAGYNETLTWRLCAALATLPIPMGWVAANMQVFIR